MILQTSLSHSTSNQGTLDLRSGRDSGLAAYLGKTWLGGILSHLTAKTLSVWAYRPPPPHHHHHPVEYTPWICFIRPLQPPSSCSPKYNGSNQAVAPPEVLAHVAIRLWRWLPCLINRCFLISFQHPKHLLIVPHLIQSILGAGTKPWEPFLCLDAVAIPTDQGNWGSGILVLNLQRSSKKNQPSPSSSTLPQTS